jgi:hypothetical protein
MHRKMGELIEVCGGKLFTAQQVCDGSLLIQLFTNISRLQAFILAVHFPPSRFLHVHILIMLLDRVTNLYDVIKQVVPLLPGSDR